MLVNLHSCLLVTASIENITLIRYGIVWYLQFRGDAESYLLLLCFLVVLDWSSIFGVCDGWTYHPAYHSIYIFILIDDDWVWYLLLETDVVYDTEENIRGASRVRNVVYHWIDNMYIYMWWNTMCTVVALFYTITMLFAGSPHHHERNQGYDSSHTTYKWSSITRCSSFHAIHEHEVIY